MNDQKATDSKTPEKMKSDGSEEAQLPSSGEKRAMPSEEAETDAPDDLKKQRVEDSTDNIKDQTVETSETETGVGAQTAHTIEVAA